MILRFNYDLKSGYFIVKKFKEIHNHEITGEYFELLPKNRRLDKNQESEVIRLCYFTIVIYFCFYST